MKVLIFSLAYIPFIGGAEVAVKEIADRLTDFSFDMVTMNLDGKQKREERIGNVNVFRIGRGLGSKRWFPFTSCAFATAISAKNTYDVIWAIMANRAGFGASFFKKKHPDVPFLLTLQEGDSEKYIWKKTWYLRPLYKKIYRRADYIQAISNYLADRAKKLGAVCPVKVVPNGVRGFSDFNDRGHVATRVREQYQISNNDNVIITVSRLVKKNGIDTLIMACKELEKVGEVKRPRLVIVGEGKQKEQLSDLSRRLGMDEQVIFLGHVPPSEVYDYLRMGDIFVRPSRSEGLGSAFLEAMSVGLPVIGTKVGGIPDFLKDRETGLFCKVDNPKDVAEKISELFNNAALRNRVVDNGKKLVKEHFQWDRIAKIMRSIFLHLREQK